MDFQECLPVHLRGGATTITPIAAGLSGAGVFRVEREEQQFVLKISRDEDSLSVWRRKLHVQRLAADAEIAPRVIHVDEARRAVLSAFVLDRSFPALYADPSTRESALSLLGGLLRRLHALSPPAEVDSKDPRDAVVEVWSARVPALQVPAFAAAAVQSLLDEQAPPCEHALVLCHNDVNPTNLVYDGEKLLLLDWNTAALNDPLYDLAAASVFFRMDAATCHALLAAYADPTLSTPSLRFDYNRRLVAILCAATLLNVAHRGGHAGALGRETLEETPSLGDFYQRLRSGAVRLATPEGQWAFGLALMKEGEMIRRSQTEP